MKTLTSAIVWTFAGALAWAPPASAYWINYTAETEFMPVERTPERHAKTATLALLLPEDLETGAQICLQYDRQHPRRNGGRIVATGEIHRDNGVERFTLRKRVRDNWAIVCHPRTDGKLPALAAGDLVVVRFQMRGMPSMSYAQGHRFKISLTVLPFFDPNR